MRKTIYKLFTIFLIFFFFINPARAQFGITLGGNISDVRHHHLLVNENGRDNNLPLIGSFMGLNFQFYPVKTMDKLSFSVDLLFNRKGYAQQFSDTTFIKRLNYLSFPIMFNYDISNIFSVCTGLELSGLMINPLNNSDKEYRDSDTGIVLGANYHFSKQWNIFTRLNYGLNPILNYYKIDSMGNITLAKDIRNINLMIGLKINIVYEKIKFF